MFFQVVGIDGDVASRTDSAFAIEEVATVEDEVTACSQQGGCRGVAVLPALEDFSGNVIDLIVVAEAIAALNGQETGNQGTRQGKVLRTVVARSTVGEGSGVECELATALHGAGDVRHLVGLCRSTVSFDDDIAQTVQITVLVGEVTDAQCHVGTAENQPAIIEQRRSFEVEVLSGAQRSVVSKTAGFDGQVGIGSQPPGVRQLSTDLDRRVATTGNA